MKTTQKNIAAIILLVFVVILAILGVVIATYLFVAYVFGNGESDFVLLITDHTSTPDLSCNFIVLMSYGIAFLLAFLGALAVRRIPSIIDEERKDKEKYDLEQFERLKAKFNQ